MMVVSPMTAAGSAVAVAKSSPVASRRIGGFRLEIDLGMRAMGGTCSSSCCKGVSVILFKIDKPEVAYLFAWNHKEEIFKKEKDFLFHGGKWISHINI